jgi:hypothetical protein
VIPSPPLRFLQLQQVPSKGGGAKNVPGFSETQLRETEVAKALCTFYKITTSRQ